MKEYIVKYTCGTSPYWYSYSYYAFSADEALDMFKKYDCPYNVRTIAVEENA